MVLVVLRTMFSPSLPLSVEWQGTDRAQPQTLHSCKDECVIHRSAGAGSHCAVTSEPVFSEHSDICLELSRWHVFLHLFQIRPPLKGAAAEPGCCAAPALRIQKETGPEPVAGLAGTRGRAAGAAGPVWRRQEPRTRPRPRAARTLGVFEGKRGMSRGCSRAFSAPPASTPSPTPRRIHRPGTNPFLVLLSQVSFPSFPGLATLLRDLPGSRAPLWSSRRGRWPRGTDPS